MRVPSRYLTVGAAATMGAILSRGGAEAAPLLPVSSSPPPFFASRSTVSMLTWFSMYACHGRGGNGVGGAAEAVQHSFLATSAVTPCVCGPW